MWHSVHAMETCSSFHGHVMVFCSCHVQVFMDMSWFFVHVMFKFSWTCHGFLFMSCSSFHGHVMVFCSCHVQVFMDMSWSFVHVMFKFSWTCYLRSFVHAMSCHGHGVWARGKGQQRCDLLGTELRDWEPWFVDHTGYDNPGDGKWPSDGEPWGLF